MMNQNGNKVSTAESFKIKKINSLAQKLEAINRMSEMVMQEFEEFNPSDPKLSSKTKVNFYEEVKRFEMEMILFALDKAGGNQRVAAEMLCLNPTTLNSKMKRYKINHSALWTT